MKNTLIINIFNLKIKIYYYFMGTGIDETKINKYQLYFFDPQI